MNNKPIITELNNGIIKANNAMPMKDITSVNEASFSMSRKLFNKSFVPNPLFNVKSTSSSVIQRESLALSNKVVIDGKKTPLQKKWIGGNRDASSVTSNRKIQNSGAISSSNNQVSFKNIKDNNTEREALIRLRGSGYRVPPKVTQKNVLAPAPKVL